MTPSSPHVLGKLDRLRAELADLAFALERRGRFDAADVANATAARVGELREELADPVASVPLQSAYSKPRPDRVPPQDT